MPRPTFKQFKFVYQIMNILCGDDMYFCILSAHIKNKRKTPTFKANTKQVTYTGKIFLSLQSR